MRSGLGRAAAAAGWAAAALELAAIVLALRWARRARSALGAPGYAGQFLFGSGSGRPLVFAVYGDSVGSGIGASALERTFAGIVARRLAARGSVLCRIAAVGGAEARTLALQRVRGDEDLAAVSIGSNDALRGAPLREIERDLAAFLARLSRARRVVVVGPGSIADSRLFSPVLRPLLRRRMLACEAAMRRAVLRFPNALHVGTAEIGPTLAPADFAEDGFHPSDEGQRRIADAVYRRIADAARS